MKNLIIILSAILVFLSFNFENSSNETSESFTIGKWHIVNYLKNGKEKQDLFTAYDFSFSKDNDITGISDNHSYKGKWSILKSEITDDAPQTAIDLKILFKCKNELSELNGEWEIVEMIDNHLNLIRSDINGESHLLLEKK